MGSFGERGGTRTLDPMIKSRVLYRRCVAELDRTREGKPPRGCVLWSILARPAHTDGAAPRGYATPLAALPARSPIDASWKALNESGVCPAREFSRCQLPARYGPRWTGIWSRNILGGCRAQRSDGRYSPRKQIMAANSAGHERLAADDEQPFMERASVSTLSEFNTVMNVVTDRP